MIKAGEGPAMIETVVEAIPAIVLLFGAIVGHLAILSVSLNLWYGHPLAKPLLSMLRRLHTMLVPTGLLVLFLLYGFDLSRAWVPPPVGWHILPAIYVLACWVVGLAVLPAMTLLRVLRRLPIALLSNHTRTVDVAAHLGYKPVGDGKYRHLARLPGNEVFRVDFTEKTFCLPNIPPAWDGLTILHLSDIHLCGTPEREFYFHVMDVCRDWSPDLVAITGDIVDSAKHHRWILPVLGRLKWKIAAFAILGNHDLWFESAKTRRRLRRLGFHVLGNDWEKIEVHGEPMLVIGNEEPWFRPAPNLSNCPPDVFRLCLSHTPDTIPWARRNGIDLMLAGHNHGGQIRLPLIGSILVPSRYSRRYDCGSFYERPTLLHVSRGLAGQHPLRYNCRPEITRIILKKVTAGAAAQVGVDAMAEEK
jgi:predicted MPP superfamily phosphohydrolase